MKHKLSVQIPVNGVMVRPTDRKSTIILPNLSNLSTGMHRMIEKYCTF